jgi:hypothetical protein
MARRTRSTSGAEIPGGSFGAWRQPIDSPLNLDRVASLWLGRSGGGEVIKNLKISAFVDDAILGNGAVTRESLVHGNQYQGER